MCPVSLHHLLWPGVSEGGLAKTQPVLHPRHGHPRQIPGKGSGLVASKDIRKGQVIFKETAAFTIHAPHGIVPLDHLKEQIMKLSEEQKTKFYQLTPQGNFTPTQFASALKENCLQELDILLSNSIEVDTSKDTLLLFITSSLLNHSCAPNVFMDKVKGGDQGQDTIVIATKDISKGEEVTDCYIRALLTKSQMKRKLQADHLFVCICCVCSGSFPDQDGIISEINQLLPSSSKYPIFHDVQTISLIWQKTNEASKLERAANLTKHLYVGQFLNRFVVFEQFVLASQMARDPIRLKKAMELLKEEVGAAGMIETFQGKGCKILETKLERWSGVFQAKKNPTKEEIDDFYFNKERQ